MKKTVFQKQIKFDVDNTYFRRDVLFFSLALEECSGELHVVIGIVDLLTGSRIDVVLHLLDAVVGHLLGQVVVQLLLRHIVAFLGGDSPIKEKV